LLVRYSTGSDGRPVKRALVYTAEEHRIDRKSIDPDALRIVEHLRSNGHTAYIVGGAVRDMLLGRRPKDFDIVTDAQPPRIRKIFRNSRVIGRRFRLVHVYAGRKIFEVSTYRSIANGTIGNTYGTIEEDALRRDFSMNALYFDPVDWLLVDYVGGFKDIQAKLIKPVIPLKIIFKEDPVRMLRAVKYSATTGFRIPFRIGFSIRSHASLLAAASPSRLTEEAIKILGCGKSEDIFRNLSRYKLLPCMLPNLAEKLSRDPARRSSFFTALGELDRHVNGREDKSLASLLAFILRDEVAILCAANPVGEPNEVFRQAIQVSRDLLFPLNMPRVELETAVASVFIQPESPPKPPRKRRRRRSRSRRGTGHGAGDAPPSLP
jgi:poly(A) polymerase